MSHENSSVHYVNNTIFWNLDANEEIGRRATGSVIYLSNVITSQEILGCSSSDEYICSETFVFDPLFSNSESDDYKLKPSSPAIDAGTVDLDGDGVDFTIDMDDQDPDGSRFDIGALYFHQVAPPSNLTAAAENMSATLNWEESPNGTKYLIRGGEYFNEDITVLDFDGVDDFVEAPNIDLTNHLFTIEFWIKIPEVAHNPRTNIIDSYEPGTMNWGIYVLGLDEYAGRDDPGLINVTGFGVEDFYSSKRIDNDMWHHISLVRNQFGFFLYINGILDNQLLNQNLFTEYNTSISTRIGSGHLSRFMKCSIAEIQVSLEAKYRNDFIPRYGLDNSSSSILHYYIGAGQGVNDLSDNGNNGTLYGSPGWMESSLELVGNFTVLDSTSSNNFVHSDLINYEEYLYTVSAKDQENRESSLSNLVRSVPVNSSNNQSLLFDGSDDYVAIGNHLDFSGSFSIAAWVKVNENDYSIDLSNSDGGESGYSLVFEPEGDDGITFTIGDGSGGVAMVTAPAIYDEWFHVAAVFHSNGAESSLSLYVNGALSNAVTTSITQHGSSNTSFVIENNCTSCGLNFIDEVSVWDSVLDDEKIADIMYDMIDVQNDENIQAYYRMERGSGTKLLDLSSNRFNGTIHEASWSDDRVPFSPLGTFSKNVSDTTNVTSINIQVRFNVDVIGLNADHLEYDNGTVIDFIGSGKEFEFILQPIDDGLVWITLPAGVVADADGNLNTASDTLKLIFDSTNPTVSFSSPVSPIAKENPIPINIEFSEPVYDLTEDKFTVTNGIISRFSDGESNAVRFDGNDYVLGTAAQSLDATGTGHLTISAWIKPMSISTGSLQTIFAVTDNPIWYHYNLSMDGNNNKLYFLSGTGNFESSGGNIGQTIFGTDQWYHVAMTYDGNAVRLYVNGNLDLVNESQDQFPSGYFGDFLIGGLYGELGFFGDIDEVSVWNRALYSYEINDLMSARPSSSADGLSAYWDLNERDGESIFDLTENNNDGSIFGGQRVDGQISDFSTNYSSYLLEINADNDAVLTLSIDENVVQDIAGNGNIENTFEITYNANAPNTPTGLKAINGNEEIVLNWDEVYVSDLGGYYLYESSIKRDIDGFFYAGFT